MTRKTIKNAKSSRSDAKRAQSIKRNVQHDAKPTQNAKKTVHSASKPAHPHPQTEHLSAQTSHHAPETSRHAPETSRNIVQTSRYRSDLEENDLLMEDHRPDNPDMRFRPEYLGRPFVLSRNIPAYMPRTEPQLVDWIQSYINGALGLTTMFPSVFGSTAVYKISAVNVLFNVLREIRESLGDFTDYTRSLRAYKNILLYADDHLPETPINSPPLPVAPVATASKIGIVGIIDEQVRLLRVTPGFDQSIAVLLGIVPRAPSGIDPATFDLNLSARSVGATVELRFRSIERVREVKFVEIWCSHGNEPRHLVGATTRASFIDTHPVPNESMVWTYTAWGVGEMGLRITPQSETTVVVP